MIDSNLKRDVILNGTNSLAVAKENGIIYRVEPIPIIQEIKLCNIQKNKTKIFKLDDHLNDFMISQPNRPSTPMLYVEAKGVINKEFEFILSVLEQNNPIAFHTLYIVFADKIPSSNQVIKNLLTTAFGNHIYKRTQFNQLTEPT